MVQREEAPARSEAVGSSRHQFALAVLFLIFAVACNKEPALEASVWPHPFEFEDIRATMNTDHADAILAVERELGILHPWRIRRIDKVMDDGSISGVIAGAGEDSVGPEGPEHSTGASNAAGEVR